jgi:TolA-binding protein
MKAALLALGIMLGAPYQCATEPNERPTEDTAPQALWMLAERFASENNPSARETTLKQLIERYPSSRYAERARHELGVAAPSATKAQASDDPEEGDE